MTYTSEQKRVIEHDGAHVAAVELGEKDMRVGPGLDAQAYRAYEQCQAVAHGGIVVHKVNQGREGRGHVAFKAGVPAGAADGIRPQARRQAKERGAPK